MAHARTRDATRRERWRHPGGRLVLLLGLIGLAGPHTCLAQGQPVFPRIDQVSGQARLVREAEAPGPLAGTVVKRGDRLETDETGRVAVAFEDGARLLVGASSTVVISELAVSRRAAEMWAGAARAGALAVAPPSQTGGLVLALERGQIRLAAQAHRALGSSAGRVEIRTEAASFACAGADVVVTVEGDGTTVLLLAGQTTIRNMAGVVELDKARHSIEHIRADAPPGRSFGRSQEMIDRIVRDLTPK